MDLFDTEQTNNKTRMSCINANCTGESHGIFPECRTCFDSRHKIGKTYEWSPPEVGLNTITQILDSYPGLVEHNIVMADVGKGAKSTITITHNICGKPWSVTIGKLVNKNAAKCPCSKHKKNNSPIKENKDSATCTIPRCKNEQHGIFSLCRLHFMEKHCPQGRFKWTPNSAGYNTVISVLQHYTDIVNFDNVKLEDIDSSKASYIEITHLVCEQPWRVRVSELITEGKTCPDCKLKRTYDYVMEQLKNRPELDLSAIKRSDVRGSHSKIPVSCTKCNHKWTPTAQNLVRGQGCASCAGNLPWTAQRLKDKPDLAAEYDLSEVSDEQIFNKRSKIPVTHKPCGYRWEVSIDSLISRRPCPQCSNHKPWSYERFMEELKDSDFDLSMVTEEDVLTYSSRVPLICKKCQHYWEPTIDCLVYGKQGCPSCSSHLPWTLLRFQECMKERPEIDSSAVTADHIVNAHSKVPLTCLLCEYAWSPIINSLINQVTGCPQCAGKVKWTLERLRDRLVNRLDINLEQVTEEMINGQESHIPIICIICQHHWSTSISSLARGTGCPKCRRSKGIQAITAYLDSRGVVYELEKTFPSLVYKSNLRIDVYIEIWSSIKYPVCIEYDGNYPGSHFSYTNDEEKARHQDCLIRDNIKDDWAARNDKHMVRIPYTCFKSRKQEEMNSVLDQAFLYLNDLDDPTIYHADDTPYHRK